MKQSLAFLTQIRGEAWACYGRSSRRACIHRSSKKMFGSGCEAREPTPFLRSTRVHMNRGHASTAQSAVIVADWKILWCWFSNPDCLPVSREGSCSSLGIGASTFDGNECAEKREENLKTRAIGAVPGVASLCPIYLSDAGTFVVCSVQKFSPLLSCQRLSCSY